jgi:thiosulfate/3-mercaptopyruvate sulfurtransferase
MRVIRLLLMIIVVLVVGRPTSADQHEALVVSVPWLAAHLNDQHLVLLHVGDKKDYETGHLPGARLVALSDISVSDRTGKGLTLEMPPAEDLRQRLSTLGISDDSRVVVYYGKDWVSPSTRVIFTLDYAGLGSRVSLLNGGMEAWVREGHPVTSVIPEPRTGMLSPLKIRPIVVDRTFVRAHLETPGFVVVDARSASLYDGVTTGGSKDAPHRTGHITGARSIPFSELTNAQLMVNPPEYFATVFSRAGVKPGDTIIGYCHIGQQATAMLFAARTLGYPVLLYDGSFEDWSRDPDLPVENPSKKGPETSGPLI